MGEIRRKYSKEFKIEAVRLLEQGIKSGPEIERDLGIGKGQVYHWRTRLRSDGMSQKSSDTNTQGIPHLSVTPHEVFSIDLKTQEKELKNSPLMKRFAESRLKQAGDRYRPIYHFVSPESMLNDPNGLCYFKGKWHMFYQAFPPDEFPKPIKSDIMNRRAHWGHAISDDLIHWRDLPYAIYPGPEKLCYSGGTLVEGDTVYAFYPGVDAGQMLAKSSDPLLLNWKKVGSLI